MAVRLILPEATWPSERPASARAWRMEPGRTERPGRKEPSRDSTGVTCQAIHNKCHRGPLASEAEFTKACLYLTAGNVTLQGGYWLGEPAEVEGVSWLTDLGEEDVSAAILDRLTDA